MPSLVGTGPNQVPSNADLGALAYQDKIAQADIFYVNSNTINMSYTLTSGKNAMSAGPIDLVSNNVTVIVNEGAQWQVF